MGAWDFGVFDNDSSLDFVLFVSHDISKFKEELNRIKDTLADESYLEVDEGSSILAMGELILSAYEVIPKHPQIKDIDLPALKKEINEEVLKSVVELCKVVMNVEGLNQSEVYELWKEADTEDYAKWKQAGLDNLTKLQELKLEK